MKNFSLLPDGMTTDEVAHEYEELLQELRVDDKINPVEAASALSELADRQWHTYELLRPDLRRAVEEWIRSHWEVSSDEYVGDLLFTIAHLGLQSLMDCVRDTLASPLLDEIRPRLLDFWKKTNGDVSDPYDGMRQ